ncbi:MAG TPA: hypothetical protein VFL67_00835, partial [Mycobacterium sp.]|nr:hypothetical protein [Mycobacterium sp.]
MSADVVFVACYALVLVACAAGLHRVGRLNTSPWASRVTAGHRRAVGDHAPSSDQRGEWPHSDAPAVYTVMGLVATAAAIVLVTAELVIHHRLLETLLLVGVGALAVWTGWQLGR